MKNLMTLLFSSLLIIFISNCSDDKNSPTGPAAGEIEIGSLLLSQEGILEDANTEILIKIEIPSGIQITDTFLTVSKLDENNNSIGEIGQLFDNGSLDNGDDIAGDNIYSGLFNIIEANSGTIRLQASGNAQSEEGLGVGKSQVAELTIYSNITEEEFAQVVNAQDNAADRFEELLSGNLENFPGAVNGTAEWLASQPGVVNIVNQGNTSIEIQFESGLYGAIIFSEVSDNGSLLTRGGVSSISSRKKSKSVPLAYQTRGETSNKKSSLSKSSHYMDLDPDVIGNKNVLIYAPFEAAFAPFNERDEIIANLNESELQFQINSLVNQDATLSALFDMTKYGFVVLATHGAGGSVFLTGELADTTRPIWKDSYKVLYTSGKIGISGRLLISKNGTVERKEKVYYVKSSFISGLAGKFPNSVILNNSCEGTKSAELQNAFIGKGAKAYYGYSKIVNSDFCVTIADSISKRLAVDFDNTAEAFLDWTDPGSPNAKFEYKKGANDVHFALRLINGDFEFGNLDGWTIEGDGRNITKLASLSPTQGSYMGIISTGLGFTTTTGKIFQSIRVEENQSNLSLKWNFLSEEFLEFINSSFQDFYRVTIIDKDGNEEVLLDKTIDILANEFGAQEFTNMEGEVPQPGNLKGVSPGIIFDRGDVYMTDWQTSTFSITKYRGDIITIVISAGDVGDSIYDTAILLDEVSVN